LPRSRQLREAKSHLQLFLQQAEHYELLEKDEVSSLHGGEQSRDPGAKRQLKIDRKRREAGAKARLNEVIKALAGSNEDREESEIYDDEVLREHGILLTQSCVRSSLDTMALIDMELELLAHADEIDHRPGEGAPPRSVEDDDAGRRPMETFTINSKEEARAKVFQKAGPMGLSYMGNGPTVSVEEFGEQEMARMQAESELKAAAVQEYVEEHARATGYYGIDLEENLKMPKELGGEEEEDEESDEKQLKARNWDDWMDANPRERYRSISGR